MSNRLQRWGERALGQVHSVSPRTLSRFESEIGSSPFEEEAGFQEIEVETPTRRRSPRIVSERIEMVVPRSPEPEIVREKPPSVGMVKDAVPPPAAAEPPPPQEVSKLPAPRTIVAKPASVPEERERPQRSEPRPIENTPPLRPEPPPSRVSTETSLVRLKRFEEWIAKPPREKPALDEPDGLPAPKQVIVPTSPQPEPRAPAPAQLPPLPRAEPPRAAPPPIVVSIGTIIVRANPSIQPKPPAPPPGDGLAAFLARRTAGQP